ncbi:35073_t:CDS:2, partial [Gigaspora margarita]
MEAEESFVKLLKLNHGFYYKNRNFASSPCPIADGGKLTLEKYTAPETTWELFEKAYSTLIDKSQKTQKIKSNFSEND